MLYERETWCLRENELAILTRTDLAMVRAMCGAKLMEKKTEDRGPNGNVGIEENSGSGRWQRRLE